MQHAAHPPATNRLLDALPRSDYQRIARHLEPVTLEFGQVLHGAGSRIRHAYFPYNSVVSLLVVVGPHKAAEVAVVGNEGVVGGSAALGIDVSHCHAVVQGAGAAMRIPVAGLRKAIGGNDHWYAELFRFTHALMNQAAQTAACNRYHKVEARLARWLLATRDRVGSNYFHLTQEFLSHMLGVRRVAVTAAATGLQQRRLIAYRRGNIQLLDPKGLEASACGCYRTVREMYRRTYRA